MKALKNSLALVLIGILIGSSYSCSKGDDSEIQNEPDSPAAFSVDFEVNENPKVGDVLGTVSSTLTGDLTYSVANQNPEGALLIAPTTGDVIVADPSKFDYESVKKMQANILVTNGTESENGNVNILVNDVDDILSFLVSSKSKENYANNRPRLWMTITKEDYESLAENLNEITRTGLDETVFDTPSENVETINRVATYVNNQQPLMPVGSSLFAFKYKAAGADASAGLCVGEAKVKLADGQDNPTFNDVGWLPCHDNGEVFFLYVGGTNPTVNEGSIAFFSSNDVRSTKSDPNQNSTIIGGDQSAVSDAAGGTTFPRAMQYQGLSTTQIQWNK